MTASLRGDAGSLLVVGLGAAELTGLERAWLRPVRPGGVILFRRNIADARQTRALLKEASGALRGELGPVCGCGGRDGGPAARCAGADACCAGGGTG